MLHAAGREVGDGEGGLHTIHIQAKRYQRGLQESCHGTDHRMILEVLWGEGALCNRRYRQGRTHWPIQLKEARPQTMG